MAARLSQLYVFVISEASTQTVKKKILEKHAAARQ